MPGDLQKALQMTEFLDTVQRRANPIDRQSALRDLNVMTVSMVPGAEAAGITLVDSDGGIDTVGATDDIPLLLDDAQREAGEGPCLSSAWEQHTILIDDLWEDRRWLVFRLRALRRSPIRSIMSFKLFEHSKQFAALNLYAEPRQAFSVESVELGLVLAAHTTLAWHGLHREQQFESALASRDVIGQAKGVLMERMRIDAVQAFDVLKKLSQDHNIRLAEVARRIVAPDIDR